MVKESARERGAGDGWRICLGTCGSERAVAEEPGFTAVAVLTLALGIGANTAIYSFMESILLRSLPVADPESLWSELA